MLKSPLAVVMSERTTAVPVFRAETFAPATTAPVESVTVPSIVVEVVWANRPQAETASKLTAMCIRCKRNPPS